ncbi:septation protein A [Candidatus Thiosymbion oneisti]|uniref:septation protein A n=1 Tax=Candidatus Thiosymbion oneisti TaxID=589554 RepID=UPI0010603B5A|nr:septation protein A [Candidatus Thiosymbion oneisti]
MKFLIDFFPVLLFFIAYKVYDIYVATAVAIVASAVQVGWFRLKHRRTETMHLVTLGLLMVFGGLTIFLQDRTFIMWKPSIVNWLFAAVFLGSHFIGERPLIERMLGQAVKMPRHIWRRLNLAWSIFFIIAGLANLYVAGQFFTAEQALVAAAGQLEVDLAACSEVSSKELLELCMVAQSREETWVNFKLFGMMGLTIVFVVAQAFYLARHISDSAASEETH